VQVDGAELRVEAALRDVCVFSVSESDQPFRKLGGRVYRILDPSESPSQTDSLPPHWRVSRHVSDQTRRRASREPSIVENRANNPVHSCRAVSCLFHPRNDEVTKVLILHALGMTMDELN
jgi:hypothetical protein